MQRQVGEQGLFPPNNSSFPALVTVSRKEDKSQQLPSHRGGKSTRDERFKGQVVTKVL